MAEFSLIAEPPLAGTDQIFGKTRLWAPADLAIVSVALPLGAEDAAKQAIMSSFDADLPEPGQFSEGTNDVWVVRMQQDQVFVVLPFAGTGAEPMVQGKLKGRAYTTDQSDAWVALCIEGPEARHALERICPVDLSAAMFPQGSAARTMMEHLGVLILRTGRDRFHLFSASSSAGSFLDALETSLRNVV